MEPKPSNPDVLIAGAGPVGLAMAAELARYGLSVRIVDKAPERSDKSKALVLWSRTLELLNRNGSASALVQAGTRSLAANILSGAEQIGHLPFDTIDSPYPFALMLPQSDTERILAEHLSSLDIQPQRSVELTAFTDSGSGVTSTLRHPDGHEETVQTSWLIGCDGAHSTVRHQLGFEFAGDTLPTDWILGDVHLTNLPAPADVNIFWHAEGLLAVFPITGTRFRVIADRGLVHPDHPSPEPTLADIQSVLDSRGPGNVTASSPIWLASFHINERKVSDYSKGRVFLAGDAAHIHSPAGGQGMNTGIQDACNLAWKLALVTHGSARPDPLLSSYTQERSAVGDQVVKGTSIATRIALLEGGFQQSLRNHLASLLFGFHFVRATAAETITELSIGYPHSPLNAPPSHGHPAPGQRAPIRPDDAPVGAGPAPLFTLFADAHEIPVEVMARHAAILDPIVRSPYTSGGLWLVRPDGYVALTTRTGDWNSLTQYLDTLA